MWHQYRAPAVLAAFLGIFLGYQISLGNQFIVDGLMKAKQVYSLQANHFRSEAIVYPGRDLDPEFKLHHPNVDDKLFILKNTKGEYVSCFPIAFAFINALIPLRISLLPFLNAFLVLPLLWKLMHIRGETRVFPALYFIAGTFAFTLLVEFTEYPLFLSLSGFGFLYMIQFWKSSQNQYFFLSAVLLGLAVWFRLEGLVFGSLLFLGNLVFFFKKPGPRSSIGVLLTGSAVFGILVVAFLAFNGLSYGHILGPRYLANYSADLKVKDKIIMFLSIVFTFPKAGFLPLGFFFYSPIFLAVLIRNFRTWRTSDFIVRFNLVLASLLVIVLAVLAPNDGIAITGRYAALAFFPCTYLLSERLSAGGFKAWEKVLLGWSFVITVITALLLGVIGKETKKHNEYFSKVKGDLVFTSNDLIAGSFGPDRFGDIIFSVTTEDDVTLAKKILAQGSYSSIQLVGYSKSFKGYYKTGAATESEMLASDLARIESLKKSLTDAGFKCTAVENKLNLNHQVCLK